MIAEKLTELRNAKGVTQEDVAKSLSVSNKTVSKWENGTSVPDLSMLAKLSGYYGVTTDALLGLSENKRTDTKDEVISFFTGLDRRESVLKAFEMARSVVSALFGRMSAEDRSYEGDTYPVSTSRGYRNEISQQDFFQFDASSENVNIAVMMLRNRANFAWMNNPETQKEIVKLFRFLSDEDVLSVLYFIHSTDCSNWFTAEYAAKHTGVNEERTAQILDEFCTVGDCRRKKAHLTEGEVMIYECYGDGVILTLISLAFEWMCGAKTYDCCIGGNCKMIGGKKIEK